MTSCCLAAAQSKQLLLQRKGSGLQPAKALLLLMAVCAPTVLLLPAQEVMGLALMLMLLSMLFMAA
jgi:hypothetical protein